MASPARRRTPAIPPLKLAPPVRKEAAEDDAAHALIEQLSERVDRLADGIDPIRRINEQGGIYAPDKPSKPYEFPYGRHVNVSAHIHDNLWRYKFPWIERGILDHMASNHDAEGQLKATQASLAKHFGCSQPRVNRALSILRETHLIWKVKRSVYQLNPRYAFRYSSSKQRALLQKIGKSTLDEHPIDIPGLGRIT